MTILEQLHLIYARFDQMHAEYLKIENEKTDNKWSCDEMKSEKREATVIIAKCKQSKLPFGIRTEKESDGAWYFTWAFKISEKAASREGYGSTLISGRVAFNNEYPGCPYCGSSTAFCCDNCGNLTCHGNKKTVTCAWCGSKGETVEAEHFDLYGGGY